MADFPSIGEFKGVPLHDFQSQERIETIVKPAIDRVLGLSDIAALSNYAADSWNPPEARLLAAAKARAAHDLAASSRIARPGVDVEKLDAFVVGLSDLDWTSPDFYGSDADPQVGEPRPAEYRAALERAQRAAREAARHG